MGEGNSFSLLVCPHPGGGGTYPGQVQTGGRGTPRYLPPRPGQDGRKGVPQGTYPAGQVKMAGGVPQGTYLPGQVRMGGGGTPR